MGRVAAYTGAEVAAYPTDFLCVVLRQVKGVVVRCGASVFLVSSRAGYEHNRSSIYLVIRGDVLINGFFVNFRFPVRERYLMAIADRFYDRFLYSFNT